MFLQSCWIALASDYLRVKVEGDGIKGVLRSLGTLYRVFLLTCSTRAKSESIKDTGELSDLELNFERQEVQIVTTHI